MALEKKIFKRVNYFTHKLVFCNKESMTCTDLIWAQPIMEPVTIQIFNVLSCEDESIHIFRGGRLVLSLLF